MGIYFTHVFKKNNNNKKNTTTVAVSGLNSETQ